MKNQIISFDMKTGIDLIEKNYILTCGLDKDKAALKRIKGHAMDCLSTVLEQTDIKAVVSFYDSSCVHDGELVIEDEHFCCPSLSLKDKDDMITVAVFAVTAGEISFDDTRVLDQAYFDIGGTSVVDAARDLLKMWISDKFRKDGELFISSSFGPGFYGMPASDVLKFFKFLDCESIGIKLLPSGFMTPPKSCVGFYVVSSRKESLPEIDCVHCLGKKSRMCNYCKAGRSKI